MPLNRCSAFVFDITTKRDRKCKLTKYFQGVCYVHARIIYRYSVTMIQRVWRGFHKRTKLNNLFFNTPRDIQMHILRYVREDFNIEKKWIPSVQRIYQNRIISFHKNYAALDELLVSDLITSFRIGLSYYKLQNRLYLLYISDQHRLNFLEGKC